MRRLVRAGLLALGLLAAGLRPATARAGGNAAGKASVQWARVDVPEGNDAARLQKLFKRALSDAVKKASFGKGKTVLLTARVQDLTVEEHRDVVRITCTVIGRVVGGSGARSRISYGGDPRKREELEREVLTQVARGLVGRLAQIARAEPPRQDAARATSAHRRGLRKDALRKRARREGAAK